MCQYIQEVHTLELLCMLCIRKNPHCNRLPMSAYWWPLCTHMRETFFYLCTQHSPFQPSYEYRTGTWYIRHLVSPRVICIEGITENVPMTSWINSIVANSQHSWCDLVYIQLVLRLHFVCATYVSYWNMIECSQHFSGIPFPFRHSCVVTNLKSSSNK